MQPQQHKKRQNGTKSPKNPKCKFKLSKRDSSFCLSIEFYLAIGI
jgi:hypothetical protein